LVGREAELSWLDARLAEVQAAGRGAWVRLGGPPGLGQRAVLRAFLERSVEGGRAQGLGWLDGGEAPERVLLDPPGVWSGLDRALARRPLVVVLSGAATRAFGEGLRPLLPRGPLLVVSAGAPGEGADLALEPVPEAELAAWLAVLAPLEPELAGRWCREAAGRPGWLVERVRGRWREGRLRPAGGW
jgi:hypothetical protein